MHRVLIVDDEEPVLESYSFLLETCSSEFILVGKAHTGYEAVQLISELKPDLVFMDINIPGIDGIEVIAQMHPKFPNMICILSTAYERFDLAKKAIPLGIFAYLVKPVSKKTFLDTLESAHNVLIKSNKPARTKNIKLSERQFLKENIWKKMSFNEWETYKELFSFHSDRGIVFLIDLEEDSDHLLSVIASKLSFRYRYLFAPHLGEGLFFIPQDVDRDKCKKYIENVLQSSIPESIGCSFAIGNIYHGTEIYRSAQEALEEIREKKNNFNVQLRERFRIIQIRRKIGISGLEEVRNLCIALWEEIFGTYNFNVAKAKMAAFFTLLVDDCIGYYSNPTEELPPFAPAEEIMPIKDITEWMDWSLQAFNKIYQIFALRRCGNFPLPLIRAIEYINEHYQEPIQLSSVADTAQVSSAYLSRLFPEYLHTNFINYITELRIEKAEKLMRESLMSIREVSLAVGYQDPNYFSKIFKKITGISPSMYLEGIRTNNHDIID